jgi:hypothetical protein
LNKLKTNKMSETVTRQKLLSDPLSIKEIDFRIQSISKFGQATILAYKDARVDMQRLDDCVGSLNWKREHTRDNKNCIISLWDDYKKEWVGKEDTGTQSMTEKDKGLASDSFKRAGFNWGIGRELYDYPLIQVKLEKNEFKEENGRGKQTWDLKLREWIWFREFTDGKLTYLAAKDQNSKVRYRYGELKKSK